jgi:hypothetical protein
MRKRMAGIFIALALLVTGTSCEKKGEAVSQTKPQCQQSCHKQYDLTSCDNPSRSPYGETIENTSRAMSDNAVLHNMALTDVHFIPCSTELNSTGTKRLERLVPYLNHYGGTIRYATYLTDEAFVAERLKHVHDYLKTTECDFDRVEIKAMMSGGRMMTAAEAIDIVKQGTGKRTGGRSAGGLVGSGQLRGGGN